MKKSPIWSFHILSRSPSLSLRGMGDTSKMEFSLSPYGTKDTEGRRQNDGFIKWTVCPNGEEGWHKVKLTLTVTQSTPHTHTRKNKGKKIHYTAAHLALLGPIPSASIFINGAGPPLWSLNGTHLTLLPCLYLSCPFSVHESPDCDLGMSPDQCR